jgi:hypothetical protein
MSDQDNDGKTELQILKDRARLMGIGFSNNISVEALKGKINAKLEGDQANADEADAQDAADEEAGLFEAPVATPAALQTTAEAAPAEVAQGEQVVRISDLVAAAAKGPKTEAVPVQVPTHNEAGRKLTKQELFNATRAQLMKDEMKLIRVRITNMDPKKKDLHGEVISVGNKYIGTVKKFIPFGETTDDGYHIPKILLDELQDRKFQDIRTVKDKRTGTPSVSSRWVREFAIEILPPLTAEELRDLAIAQAAAGSLDA